MKCKVTFFDPLVLTEDHTLNPKGWVVWQDFHYLIEFADGRSFARTVPAGFHTDLASVPEVLQNIFPPNGKGNRAFCAHDWEYTICELAREDADAVLLAGMETCGCPAIDDALFYEAVRIGGGGHWTGLNTFALNPADVTSNNYRPNVPNLIFPTS
jgi:hypothetical protein